MSIRGYHEEINSRKYKIELEGESLINIFIKVRKIVKEYKNQKIKNTKFLLEFNHFE